MKRRALLASLGTGAASGCLRLERGETTTATTDDRESATTRRPTTTEPSTTTADTTPEPDTETETETETENDGPLSLAATWPLSVDDGRATLTADGAFYVAGGTSILKVSPDGSNRWRSPEFPDGQYVGDLAIHDGLVGVAFSPVSTKSPPASVAIYDAATGETLAENQAPDNDALERPAAIGVGSDTAVYSISEPGQCSERTERLTALDTTTGAVRWTTEIDGQCVHDYVVLDDRAVAATTDGLLEIDLASGDVTPTVDTYYGLGAFTLAGNTLYGGGETIDARTLPGGDRQWSQRLPDRINSDVAPQITDDAVYAGTRGGHVAAIDRDTGTSKWRTTLDAKVSGLATSTDHVWAGDTTGAIVALDPATGDVVFTDEPTETTTDRSFGIVDDTILIEEQAYRIERN